MGFSGTLVNWERLNIRTMLTDFVAIVTVLAAKMVRMIAASCAGGLVGVVAKEMGHETRMSRLLAKVVECAVYITLTFDRTSQYEQIYTFSDCVGYMVLVFAPEHWSFLYRVLSSALVTTLIDTVLSITLTTAGLTTVLTGAGLTAMLTTATIRAL